MLKILLPVLAFAAFSAPSLAAQKPMCATIDKAKEQLPPGTTFKALTPGQFHFMQGIYVVLPNTPEGFPPGNGAILARSKDLNGAIVLWTRGILACNPLHIPPNIVDMLGKINTGELDDSGNEL